MEFNTFTEIPNLHQIKQVAEQLKGVVYQTPLQFSHSLSERFGANIYLKREDLQLVRSYKIRGAFHKISNLPLELRQKGVVAASAGNHAQGVAYACASLKIHATIFMPQSTPLQKVEAVRFFGKDFARIKLIGDTYDEAFRASKGYCESTGAVYIPPFDDYDIIAGQATLVLEIVDQAPKPIDYLIVPVGGGGLASGAALVKEYCLNQTILVGVEPSDAASLTLSLAKGKVTELEKMDPFVDGASVRKMGELTFSICQKYMDIILRVEKQKLCQTMLDLYDNESILAEPAGALSIACLEQLASSIRGKTVVCVVSGGNFDSKRFPEIKKIASGE
ncbi:MAG: threonine ammonia-lyase IlvA [Aquirufa sp.]